VKVKGGMQKGKNGKENEKMKGKGRLRKMAAKENG
jgi:hypothetical protein